MADKKKILNRVLYTGLGVVVAMQLVPYGRDHTNPASGKEPAWDSPQTRELVVRACYDCHSNETRWPWYSNVAPVSWLLQHHVNEGREHLNFTEWDKPQKHAHEAAHEVEEGEMPMWSYLLLHGEADLPDADKQALMRGLEASFGKEGEGAEHGEHGEGEGHEH
jgi:mono/diheme cytochrome c family protein